VRLYIRRGDRVRAILLVEFGKDLSFYLTPLAKKGDYYYGEELLAAAQVEKTFPFSNQHQARKAPRLSFHENGFVHVKVGRKKVGPLQIP
jgi:hypothetical protein